MAWRGSSRYCRRGGAAAQPAASALAHHGPTAPAAPPLASLDPRQHLQRHSQHPSWLLAPLLPAPGCTALAGHPRYHPLCQHPPRAAAPHPPPGPRCLPGLPVGRWKMLDAGGATESQSEPSRRSQRILRAGGRTVPGGGAGVSDVQRDVPQLRWGPRDMVRGICRACSRGHRGVDGQPGSVGGSSIFTVQRGCPLTGHWGHRMSQPHSLVSCTSYRPLCSHRFHPTSPTCALPQRPLRPASVTAATPQCRGLCRGQTRVAVLPGRGDTGGGERVVPAPALSPSRGGQRPRSPAAPRSLGVCSHGGGSGERRPCPRSLPRRRLFPLSSLFFPPNTSLRNARGGGSTISHCEHLSLYCSARQNTAVPANKHPFIRRPQRQGENAGTAQAPGSPPGRHSLPSALAPGAGVVLSAPANIRAIVPFVPLPAPRVPCGDAAPIFWGSHGLCEGSPPLSQPTGWGKVTREVSPLSP